MSNRYPTSRAARVSTSPLDYPGATPRTVYKPSSTRRRAFVRPVRPLFPVPPREFYKPPNWPAPGFKPRPSYVPSPPVRRIPRGLGILSRMFPYLGWVMLGYELTRWTFPSRRMNSDAVRYCSNFNPQVYNGNVHYGWAATPTAFCTSRVVSDATGGYSPGAPWLQEFVDGVSSPGGQPLMWGRRQMWFDIPGPSAIPGSTWRPGWVIPVPDPLPAWVTGPLAPPLSGTPAPFGPPVRGGPPDPPVEAGDPLKWRWWPDPEKRPRNRPWEDAPEVWPFDADTWPPPKYRPPPRDRPRNEPKPWQRPAPRIREKKARVQREIARELLGKILSGYSELGDLIDALYEGVPKDLRTKGADMQQKLLDIYNAGDRYDMVKALTAVWNEAAEDRVWGRTFGKAAKELDAWGVELPFLRDGYTYLIR